jgi:inorganic phosphate transporter, PiT family
VPVTEALFILCVVVLTALAFDFTNGFHDTANAMATSVATGALKPKAAVALSAILNLVGAFLSIQVALTVSNKIISIQGPNGEPVPGLMGVPMLVIILAGLVGGILWNLLTWLFGLPSSSSHALFGGLIGATIAALGLSGVGRGHHVDRVAGGLRAAGSRPGRRCGHLGGFQDRDDRAGTAAR